MRTSETRGDTSLESLSRTPSGVCIVVGNWRAASFNIASTPSATPPLPRWIGMTTSWSPAGPPLRVLPGPESVLESTGVIRRELGSHVPRSSEVADQPDLHHATESRLGAILTLSLTHHGPGSQHAVSRSVRTNADGRSSRQPVP